MRQKWKRLVLILSGLMGTLLIAAGLAVILFFPEMLPSRAGTQCEATTEIFAMDTYITMTAYGRNAETAALLSFALQIAEETDGALEPTIYPLLTAWGFTTEENRVPSDDEITELLKNVGYERIRLENTTVQLDGGMMLDLGGNIQAIGDKTDGSPWRLGLRNPFSDGTLGVLEISNQAVVTSGAYERYFIGEDGTRYGHIIDPATGYPAESGLASVTVIADEGRLCDALSTSLYVMGTEKALDYWKEHQNFEMILITENGEIYLTDGIADYFHLDSYHSNMTVQVMECE